MVGATELPTTNAVANKITATPSEILTKCMQGGQIDSTTLTPLLGCNQTPSCLGISYDTEMGVCTLLGGYTDPNEMSTSTTVSTYLKNCSCSSGGGTTADISCGSNIYGSQQCPTGTCYGDTGGASMSAYCCMDGNEPAGCTVTSNGLTSGVFVPYMYYGSDSDNFSTNGCVSNGTCPIISFSPVGSYNVNVYVNKYTAYSSRMSGTKVAECRLENISCQNDCITEIAYIIGFPDLLPTTTAGDNTYCYRGPDPGTEILARSPDTLLMIKGRMMSSKASTNFETLSCAPFFSQDVILARLMTNSNRTDWIDLFQKDNVLQSFLNDRRFPPTTKFYWHPGNLASDGTPMGIQVSDENYSTVWVDPASLNNETTYCVTRGSTYIFENNVDLAGKAPACAVPFLAGCRYYTNPDGYFIPSGTDEWHLTTSNAGASILPSVYDTTTLDRVVIPRTEPFQIPYSDELYCDEIEDQTTTLSSEIGLCGTTCAFVDEDSSGLLSGFCQDLDTLAGDSECALALKKVIGDTTMYDYASTWCLRDNDDALGLGLSNPCFVHDVRRVMSGNAAGSAMYGLHYGGTSECTALQ